MSWLRLPAAVLAASRIAAFRWRIPYVNMTVLEFVMTIAYMAALFVWDFTRCTSPSLSTLLPLAHKIAFVAHGLSLPALQLHAALLAVAQFPLIVALAMKNNAIQCTHLSRSLPQAF